MTGIHKNILEKIYIIQEYTKMQQAKGIPNTRIVQNISFVYPISMPTFYNYMGINAKAQLRAMNTDFEALETRLEAIISIIPETYQFNKQFSIINNH